MSRNKTTARFFSRPALFMSAGFFALLLSPLHASEETEAVEGSGFSFPKVTFFWQRDSFKHSNEQKLLNLPKLPEITFFWQRESFKGPYSDPEALQISQFPSSDEDRLRFNKISRNLAADPNQPELERFRTKFLNPIEPFLLPQGEAQNRNNSEDNVLSLKDALIYAFSSNPSIQVRDLQIAVEDERLKQAEKVFQPTIEISSEYSESEFPQNASESSANNLFPTGGDPRSFLSKTAVLEAAVSGENAVGTQYEVYSNLRYNQSTLTRTSLSALYPEEYTTNLGLRVTQPILRNSSRTVREAPIRIARINRKIATADLTTELTRLAERTLIAYYSWIEANELLSLRKWEERTYQRLAEIIRKKVETGDATPREVLRIEIRLTRVEDRILQAEEQRDLARQRLFAEFGERFSRAAHQETRPAGEMPSSIPEISLSETIEGALNHSAEIKRIRGELEVNRENLGVALDETRSSLNLVGGVEWRGLNSSPDRSITSLTRETPFGFNVGVVYSRPWSNEGAEAQVRENRFLVRQTEIELERMKQEIRDRIESEYRRLKVLSSRHRNLQSLQSKIGDEIDRENTRLETGQSTLSSLLEYYEELFQARAQYIALLAQINDSKSKLWTADQSLLGRIGVTYYNSLEASGSVENF